MKVLESIRSLLDREVDDYEVFMTSGRTLTIEVKEGKVDSFERADTHGLGLRVLKDGRMGFSYTSSLEKEDIRRVVEDAIGSAHNTCRDDLNGFPERGEVPSLDLAIYDPSLSEIGEEEKVERALLLESSARAFDRRVKRVRKASYRESTQEVTLARRDWTLSYPSTKVSCGIIAIAEEKGDSQMGWDWDNRRGLGEIDPAAIGRRAAERAVRLLGARKGEAMKAPVILENAIAAEFLEILSSSFLGDNVHKGKSMLKGKRGEALFSPLIDIVDDGLLRGGWGSSPFDGEGVPRRRTILIEKGVLKGYLYDHYWARKEGMGSTGNSSRMSFKTPPSIATTNLYIEKGDHPFQDLVKGIEKGLIITDLLGAHTANPVTGEFSFGAMGFFVERGRPIFPVKGIAIAGNILDVFRDVKGIGDDLRFFGGIGSPSLLVEAMDISG